MKYLVGVIISCVMALSVQGVAHAADHHYYCNNTPSTAYTVIDPKVQIVVGKGDSCYLDGASVKSVRAKGAKNLYVIDSTVAHNIMAKGVTRNVVIGSKGCKYDPEAGNNIHVFKSHNVAICMETVDNNIHVSQNDGRITLRHNVAGDNIMVTNNYAYNPLPGDGTHKNVGAIRFSGNTAGHHNFVRHNSGRKVIAENNTPAVT